MAEPLTRPCWRCIYVEMFGEERVRQLEHFPLPRLDTPPARFFPRAPEPAPTTPFTVELTYTHVFSWDEVNRA